MPLAAIREQALGRYAKIIVVANNVFPHLFFYKSSRIPQPCNKPSLFINIFVHMVCAITLTKYVVIEYGDHGLIVGIDIVGVALDARRF